MKKRLEMLLHRTEYHPTGVMGFLECQGFNEDGEDACDDSGQLCKTLEPENFIPEGKYQVIVNESYHFGRELPLLLSVPKRSSIRIHRGNTVKDTQGCILVGEQWEKVLWLKNSAKAEITLTNLIKSYETAWIEVSKDASLDMIGRII